jgi:uncharacterized protein YndB with AHSA1/START domain
VDGTPDSVTRQVSIEASIEAAWQLVTVAEDVQTWYAFDGASIDLRRGGAIEHYWHEHGRFRGIIEELSPPTVFAYRYSTLPDVEPAPGHQTLVTFELASTGPEQTLVRVTESGLADLDLSEEERAAYLAVTTQGWVGGLAALAERVA